MAESYDAFNAELKVGTAQTEYAIIICDTDAGITTAGDGRFTVIAAGMTGGTIITDVALAEDDLPAEIARKAAIALNAIADIAAWMTFYPVGINLYCRLVEAAGPDGSLNIAFANTGTLVGLTDDPDSEDGVGGVAEVETASVTNISGPSMGVDTEDVTTHDQTVAFEEVVATIIRSGEVTLDIVYDPVDNTHDGIVGLLFRMETKLYSFFKLIFSDDAVTEWVFSGYVTGFEPSAPFGGALTATVKIKITAEPTLA